jgi:hypothetical protein
MMAVFMAASLCAWPFTSGWVPVTICGSVLALVLLGTGINAVSGHPEPLKRTFHQMYGAIALIGDVVRF